MFYNTAKLAGRELKQAHRDSDRQMEQVFLLFKKHSKLTPWQAWQLGVDEGKSWLITSVRVQVHGLTAKGLLVKTDERVPGPHGKPEHVWSLV